MRSLLKSTKPFTSTITIRLTLLLLILLTPCQTITPLPQSSNNPNYYNSNPNNQPPSPPPQSRSNLNSKQQQKNVNEKEDDSRVQSREIPITQSPEQYQNRDKYNKYKVERGNGNGYDSNIDNLLDDNDDDNSGEYRSRSNRLPQESVLEQQQRQRFDPNHVRNSDRDNQNNDNGRRRYQETDSRKTRRFSFVPRFFKRRVVPTNVRDEYNGGERNDYDERPLPLRRSSFPQSQSRSMNRPPLSLEDDEPPQSSQEDQYKETQISKYLKSSPLNKYILLSTSLLQALIFLSYIYTVTGLPETVSGVPVWKIVCLLGCLGVVKLHLFTTTTGTDGNNRNTNTSNNAKAFKALSLSLSYLLMKSLTSIPVIRSKYPITPHVSNILGRGKARVSFPPYASSQADVGFKNYNPWKYQPSKREDPDFSMTKTLLVSFLMASVVGYNVIQVVPFVPSFIGVLVGGVLGVLAVSARHGKLGDIARLLVARIIYFVGVLLSLSSDLGVIDNVTEVISIVVGWILVFDGKHKVRDKVFYAIKGIVGIAESGVRRVRGEIDGRSSESERTRQEGGWEREREREY